MKRLTFVLGVFLSMSIMGLAQNNAGINDNNSNPNASAMLDVYSVSKGLLIPRIALTSTTVTAPVISPEASLLIYNTATAGDVTPGYYYWDGTSKWVRLVANGDPVKNFNFVTKSANATLLKSENLVFASGNITLTLPTVTSGDDGLEISVKNTGTYTDLITVAPEAGKSIDATTTSPLTRWRGKTFIATGSNWIIKDKETRIDNQYEVSALGSFTTIAEIIGFLNAHPGIGPSVVKLGGGTYSIAATQTINLTYPVTFEGCSYGETHIVGAAGVSGSPLFICQTECYFKMLDFTAFSNGAGNDGLRFTNAGTYHEIKDCSFTGFNKGIVSTNSHSLLWIFEVAFVNCPGAGIEVAAGAASGGSLKVSECLFEKCAIGINLLSGVAGTVSIYNSNFYNTTSGTDIGILYNPAAFTSSPAMYISSNAWNNQGTFMSGFDFTRSDGRDANVFQMNNLGMEDENPHGRISVRNNVSTATVTTAGTFYKADWAANTTIYTCKWGIGSTSPTSGNRFTYLPTNKRDAYAIITGNLSNSAINQVVTIAIVKNGITTTRYGETDLRVTIQNQPFQFSTVIYIPDLVKNDYMELYVTTSHNGDAVTIQDLQWFINTK